MGTCRGSLYECPYVRIYQDKLIKPNYDYPIKNIEIDKHCRKVRRASSSKPEPNDVDSDKSKTSNKSKVSDEDKYTSSSSAALVRSTRAQDLRSQCNRDLLKPKSVCEKTRVVSPYVVTQQQQQQQQQKKKRSSVAPATNRSVPTPKHGSDDKRTANREKSSTSQSCRKQKRDKLKDTTTLQREKTQEVIRPKVVTKKEVGDSGDRPGLKKSQTFFICKGPKRGEGDDAGKVKASPPSSSPDNSDSEYDEPPSPEPNPLTHNDSFCLIVKSSQNWSRRKRRDEENRFREPTMVLLPKSKKGEKGILKTPNRDLKSVDSLEKIDSDKIVRFSDELLRKRKVLRKYVRRKNKMQNTIVAAWYRKNKIFQKYLQVLRAKSVLHSNPDDVPENLKPFQVPVFVRERYEAEMLGLVPRKSKSAKGRLKKNNY